LGRKGENRGKQRKRGRPTKTLRTEIIDQRIDKRFPSELEEGEKKEGEITTGRPEAKKKKGRTL